MTGSQPTVLVESAGGVATLILNRPVRRNGLTVAMCHALYRSLQTIAQSDARVLILRGAGDDFCVGADLAGGPEQDVASAVSDLGDLHHAATLLHSMPQVTIAAIDGGCAGAGLGYAAACDFRFATPESRFSTAFLNVGVSGDMGLAWSLHRVVGPARARELLFFPEKLTGADALALGLVTRIYPRDQIHAEVARLAVELAGKNAEVLRSMKANCLSAERLSLSDFVDIETARHLQSIGGSALRKSVRD